MKRKKRKLFPHKNLQRYILLITEEKGHHLLLVHFINLGKGIDTNTWKEENEKKI